MLSSNCGTSPPLSVTDLPNVPTVHGVEEEKAMNQLSQSPERRKLKLSTSVIEPLVVELDASRFGDFNCGRYLIILPKRGSRSLQDCILIRPENWELSGLPNYWIYTASVEKRPLGRSGAWNLVQGALWCQSAHQVAWLAALKYVDRRYKYPMSRPQRRSRIEFWMSRGWAGSETLKQVQLSLLKTPFQLLKSHVISKWHAFMDRT